MNDRRRCRSLIAGLEEGAETLVWFGMIVFFWSGIAIWGRIYNSAVNLGGGSWSFFGRGTIKLMMHDSIIQADP